MTVDLGNSLVGTTIAGRYHLVRQLGDGGMGAVFKAADQVLRRFVAVKLLHPSMASNPSAVERFVREARSAAAIGHPNIIEIIDFGDDHGRPFLVMEYLKGQSLSQLIAVEAPFRVARAAAIATHALAGLAAAHARQILHRDLKPANLMVISRLGDRDFVKVCDFGFATLLAPKRSIHDGTSLTPARTLVGTPAYASPERLRGDDRPDPRIDVYAMGVVLFEMLTGQRPFEAPTFAELAAKIRNDAAPTLASIRRDLPAGLSEVVARALAKDREHRWSTAEAFAEALVPYGGKRVADPSADEDPSDVFTMDVLRLRARETEHHRRTLGGSSRSPSSTKSAGAALAAVAKLAEEEPASESYEVHVSLDDSDEAPLANGETARGDDDGIRATEPTPVRAPEVVLDTSRAIGGSSVLSVLRFVEGRYGPRAVREVVHSLDAGLGRRFYEGVSERDFVPLATYEALVQAIDARLGDDDLQIFAACGRAASEPLLPLFRETTPKPTVETMLVELPRVVSRSFRGVGVRSRAIGRGYGTVEVVDGEAHGLATCVSFLGLIERALASSAARDLEVSCTSCTALGDAECLMHVSWFAQ